MNRRLPLLPTILVGLAIVTMIGLGIWQLNRARWKEGLLANYARAAGLPPVSWPAVVGGGETMMFRRASAFCVRPFGWEAKAGRNRAGEVGWSHVVSCMTGGAEGPGLRVDAGWSQSAEAPGGWRGGAVRGVVTRDRHGPILVASDPVPGLQASAPPDMTAIPNNHRAYAVQWFAFAVTALVIYGLALRRRR